MSGERTPDDPLVPAGETWPAVEQVRETPAPVDGTAEAEHLTGLGALPTPPSPAAAPHRFGAARALAILVFSAVAQVVAAMTVLAGAFVIAIGRGEFVNSAAAVSRLTERSTVALLLVSALFTAGAVLLGARWLARDAFYDRTATGIGRLSLTKREAAWSFIAGAGLSLLYGAFCTWVMPPDPATPLGPLAKAAVAGGASTVAWVLLAIVFAPLIEELLFRGLVLRGFTESWGRVPAAIAVTVIFIVMHLFETASYWPATVAVAMMAMATLMARLRTGSLAAAAVVHFAYNGTIVAMSLLWAR